MLLQFLRTQKNTRMSASKRTNLDIVLELENKLFFDSFRQLFTAKGDVISSLVPLAAEVPSPSPESCVTSLLDEVVRSLILAVDLESLRWIVVGLLAVACPRKKKKSKLT